MARANLKKIADDFKAPPRTSSEQSRFADRVAPVDVGSRFDEPPDFFSITSPSGLVKR